MPFITNRTTSCIRYDPDNDACLPCTDPFERKKCFQLYSQYKQASSAQDQLEARLNFYEQGCVPPQCYNQGHCQRLQSLDTTKKNPRVRAFCDQAAKNRFWPQDVEALERLSNDAFAALLANLSNAPEVFQRNAQTVLTTRLSSLQQSSGDILFQVEELQTRADQLQRKYADFDRVSVELEQQLLETNRLRDEYRAQLDATLESLETIETQSQQLERDINDLLHLREKVDAFRTYDIDLETLTLEEEPLPSVEMEEKEMPLPPPLPALSARTLTDDQLIDAELRKQKKKKKRQLKRTGAPPPVPYLPPSVLPQTTLDMIDLLESTPPPKVPIRLAEGTAVAPRYAITMRVQDAAKLFNVVPVFLITFFKSPIVQKFLVTLAQRADTEAIVRVGFLQWTALFNDVYRRHVFPPERMRCKNSKDAMYILYQLYDTLKLKLGEDYTVKEADVFDSIYILNAYTTMFSYDFGMFDSIQVVLGIDQRPRPKKMDLVYQCLDGIVYRGYADVIAEYLLAECTVMFQTQPIMHSVVYILSSASTHTPNTVFYYSYPEMTFFQLVEKMLAPTEVRATGIAYLMNRVGMNADVLVDVDEPLVAALEEYADKLGPLTVAPLFMETVERFVPQLFFQLDQLFRALGTIDTQ